MREPDNTGFMFNLLQTSSLFRWLDEFFSYSRRGIAQGWFDETRAMDQFRDKILEGKPKTFMGNPITTESVDWQRLYEECKEITQPADWEKASLRAELEKRGVDPASFGWDLGAEEAAGVPDNEASPRQLDPPTQPSAKKAKFRQIEHIDQLTRRLAPQYLSQVGTAGPVIGALTVSAALEHVQSPPSPSPVAAHLVDVVFETFRDLPAHLRSERDQGISHLGKRRYEAWTKRILALATDPHALLALSVPLLVESQISSVQSSAQDILLRFLAPLIDSPSAPLVFESKQRHVGKPNVEIIGILHAGQVPFLIVCHPSDTLNQWWNALEAATVLLLPQVIIAAEQSLSPGARQLIASALSEEARAWRRQLPRIGGIAQWEWLPALL
jgi:hypothetical protein